MSYMRCGYPLKYFKTGLTDSYIYGTGEEIIGGVPYDNRSLCELLTNIVATETKDPYYARQVLRVLADRLGVADDLKEYPKFSTFYTKAAEGWRKDMEDENLVRARQKLPEYRMAYEIYDDWRMSKEDSEIFDVERLNLPNNEWFYRCRGCDFVGRETDFDKVHTDNPSVMYGYEDNTTLKCKKCGYEAEMY